MRLLWPLHLKALDFPLDMQKGDLQGPLLIKLFLCQMENLLHYFTQWYYIRAAYSDIMYWDLTHVI